MASSRGRYDDLEVEDDDDTPAFDFKGKLNDWIFEIFYSTTKQHLI